MSDERFDELCNLLFDSSRDWYTEEEYNGDGNLLYKPPPLDNVWLSKPEQRERRDALEQQHRRCDNFERQRDADTRKELGGSGSGSSPDLPVTAQPDDSSVDDDPLACDDSGSEGDDNDDV